MFHEKDGSPLIELMAEFILQSNYQDSLPTTFISCSSRPNAIRQKPTSNFRFLKNHQFLCLTRLLFYFELSWVTKWHYQDPYAKRFMKDEKITKTAYIANSGGLLGLCMGFRSVSKVQEISDNLKHWFLAWCLLLRFSTTVSLVCSGGASLFFLFRWFIII